ncbi:MAG TPA: hypothetical protein VHA74_04035, partial [Candidatus Dojkabacteria bacterium]|nr:hypothetical protein [Candidatus Dojkabacteria bacterium]
SVAGATVQWDLLYFVVDDYDVLEKGQSLEMGEDIQIVPVELEQVKELCLSNKDEMKEDRSVAVLLKFLHTLDIV